MKRDVRINQFCDYLLTLSLEVIAHFGTVIGLVLILFWLYGLSTVKMLQNF